MVKSGSMGTGEVMTIIIFHKNFIDISKCYVLSFLQKTVEKKGSCFWVTEQDNHEMNYHSRQN